MKLIPATELNSAKGINYSRCQIWRLIKQGEFPRPIKCGQNRNAFLESEIDAWIEEKVAERNAKIAQEEG